MVKELERVQIVLCEQLLREDEPQRLAVHRGEEEEHPVRGPVELAGGC